MLSHRSSLSWGQLRLGFLAILCCLSIAAPRLLGQAPHTDSSPAAHTSLSVAGLEAATNPAPSIFQRVTEAGPIVSLVLLILVTMSIVTWAVVVAKWLYLRRMETHSRSFIKSFWDSRSLNDLNTRLGDYPYSPIREVFRSGYAELVRGSQLKDQMSMSEVAISAAIDNLNRTLYKAKIFEKRQLERFLSILAISASACPFIGLFGTVWGIMTAFEGIARTGSSSLAAVAPGISEALIATAFGLAAAIPAVIGYNIAANQIRGLVSHIDGFGADFLNIVERYLVTDRSKNAAPSPQPPRI